MIQDLPNGVILRIKWLNISEALIYCLAMRWIEKIWSVYTMEYYSAIKKNEILLFAMMWMELEGIMLNEVSQSEKDKYHMISLIYGIETQNR
uniref:DUF1725 domain-containing protein n=1 Tax=Canis lupus dingo TaxID=286419 RepID=A0A8C0QSY5_CANLU